MVTKDTVLSRHHHLTLFWKYSAHRGRWALSKIREGGKQRTKLPLLNVMIICLEYPGKQLTCYYQKKKKKNPNPEKLGKVFGYRKTKAIYRKDTRTSEKMVDQGHVNTSNKISFWMHQTGKD